MIKDDSDKVDYCKKLEELKIEDEKKEGEINIIKKEPVFDTSTEDWQQKKILDEIYSCLDEYLNGVHNSKFKEKCLSFIDLIDHLEAKGNTRAILIKGVCFEDGIIIKDIEKAKECYIRAYIDEKDPLALYEHATCLYMEGKYAEALEMCLLAEIRGNKFAMSWLGARYLNGGNGVEQNNEKALEYFRKGAEAGSAWGMLNLAGKLYSGMICEKNEEEAREWYRKAALIGNKSAIENLFEKFGESVSLPSNIKSDHQNEEEEEEEEEKKENELNIIKKDGLTDEELAKFAELDEENRLDEIYSCLDKYLNGVSDSKFKEQCLAHMKIINQMEAKGSTRAILLKGVCYEDGFVIKNLEKAKECYIKSYIDQKDSLALYELATCLYMDGKYLDAMEKCELAADKGNKFAMSWLGARYLNGDNGIEQNNGKALEYLRKGAEAGSAWGMINLARVLYEGTLIEKNVEEAREWYKKAAKIGNKTAIEQLIEKFGEDED